MSLLRDFHSHFALTYDGNTIQTWVGGESDMATTVNNPGEKLLQEIG
jgi:hypothetical protein